MAPVAIMRRSEANRTGLGDIDLCSAIGEAAKSRHYRRRRGRNQLNPGSTH